MSQSIDAFSQFRRLAVVGVSRARRKYGNYAYRELKARGLDVMAVQVEVTPEVFGDTVGALERLQEKLNKSIETTVGLRANVRLVQPRTLQRSEGKAKRVLDQRKM